MKTTKTILTLLGILFFYCSESYGQTIPNSGFENWTGGQFAIPNQWRTNASDMSIAVLPTSQAHTGNIALLLNRKGFAKTKFSFSQYPFNINAFVRAYVSTNDTVKIKVSVYSGNALVNIVEWTDTALINNWTQISISVDDSLTSQVDSVGILISGGQLQSTQFVIDDITVSSQVGIKENTKTNYSEVFPNPFSQESLLKTSTIVTDAILRISNSLGQIINESIVSGNSFTINRNNLPSGLYFIQLTKDGKIVSSNKVLVVD